MNETLETPRAAPAPCWCGNAELAPFSPDYLRCPVCETLVTTRPRSRNLERVVDDESDFYGRSYWFDHQECDLKSSTIVERARSDLYERCVFWLRTLLKYKLPPGRSLELGCGHGGFVALLRWVGFDASGLELSPWVVEFAREAFGVPVLCGRVEDQEIPLESLDLIVLLDVLEHLPDPLDTMRHCMRLLKPDGLALIQVPRFPAERSYAELAERNDLFLKMLMPDEHLQLFSQPAMQRFLGELGLEHAAFEEALAGHDMLVVASRRPLPSVDPQAADRALSAEPSARLVRALIDAEQHVAQQLARLREYATRKERDMAELRSWVAKKDHSAEEYVASLRAQLAHKESELALLGAHMAQKDVTYRAQIVSLEQQVAEKTQSCEVMRAYAAEKEQALAEELRRRSSLRAMLGVWAARRFAAIVEPIRYRGSRLKRRLRSFRIVEWSEWLLSLRGKPLKYLLGRLRERTREKLRAWLRR